MRVYLCIIALVLQMHVCSISACVCVYACITAFLCVHMYAELVHECIFTHHCVCVHAYVCSNSACTRVYDASLRFCVLVCM